jgi:hypothetical protein
MMRVIPVSATRMRSPSSAPLLLFTARNIFSRDRRQIIVYSHSALNELPIAFTP